MNVRGIPVILNRLVPLERTGEDGIQKPALCWVMRLPAFPEILPCLPFGPSEQTVPVPPPRIEITIHVHPDRWDAFWMAVNQPDIFAHPEVRALLVPDAATR